MLKVSTLKRRGAMHSATVGNAVGSRDVGSAGVGALETPVADGVTIDDVGPSLDP
jgi:hypothetical protein